MPANRLTATHRNQTARALLVRFALTFLGLVLLFSTLVQVDLLVFDGAVGGVVSNLSARLAAASLALLGADVARVDNTISYRSAAFQIVSDCTGVEVIGLFVAAVLAFPSGPRRKVSGLILGIPVLLVVNLVRMVTLIDIGARYPETLEYGHLYLWPVIILAVALAMWLSWARSADRDRHLLA
ncbi:MAG: exosortase H [Deltaproteobacteria bacterium]|nr:exosortase H [Deltaproteobacteria bacterium]